MTPTICACENYVIPVGAYSTIELDGGHHGVTECEPCEVPVACGRTAVAG